MRPTLTPVRSVSALMTTVVPWARKPTESAATPAFAMTSNTPFS